METFRFIYDDLRIVASIYSNHSGNKLNVPVIRLLPGAFQNTGFDFFNAKRNHSGVFLKWKVSNPRKDDTFYIFKNVRDNVYDKIGLIQLEGLTGEQDQFVYIDKDTPGTRCNYVVERYRFNHLLARSETAHIDAINKNPFVTCNIYPEPAENAIGIQLYSSAELSIMLSLFDNKNTLILQKPIIAETGMNQYVISLNNIPPGNYMIGFDYAGCINTIEKRLQVMK